jgi:hypothetical protein
MVAAALARPMERRAFGGPLKGDVPSVAQARRSAKADRYITRWARLALPKVKLIYEAASEAK